MKIRQETFVSVDVECSGPTPSTGSLISIGACLVDDPARGFYIEMYPEPECPWSDEAEQVHRLSRQHLAQSGLPPHEAMEQFERWLQENCDHRAIFVGFNAPFDWMFVADAFWKYLGRNPFGISGMDLKSYAMGRLQLESWGQTNKRDLRKKFPTDLVHTHNALDDAREQAQLLRALRAAR
jgi:DNA polymerase III epsilon subunit-like protein